MATPGWYPDPGGTPDRYRFWDGQRWSDATSPDPRDRPPDAGTPANPPRGSRSGGRIASLVVVVVVAVVVGALVAAQVVRTDTRRREPIVFPSIVGDRHTPAGPVLNPCTSDNPLARRRHPTDGRVHGGGLSIPAQRGWQTPGQQVSNFSWAHDVGESDGYVRSNWLAAYAVGAVSTADGFESPRAAAEATLACTGSLSFYRAVTSRRRLTSRSVRVGGRPGWVVRSQIRMPGLHAPFAGDVVEVVVVDLGSPGSLAFFWGSAPIGDGPLQRRLARTVAGLSVD